MGAIMGWLKWVVGAAAPWTIPGLVAADEQAKAAKSAAKAAKAAGEEASGLIESQARKEEATLRKGYSEADYYLDLQRRLLGGGEQRLQEAFGQERQIGSEGLQALRDAVLGGGQGYQLSPAAQFQLQQGEQARQRAAAAAGDIGGGRYFKDYERFAQGVASQDYQQQIQRLAGLAGIGQAANANYANLGQQLLGAQAGTYGARSQLATQQGTSLANLFQQNAFGRANIITGQQAQANQYNVAAANAQAAGIAGAYNTTLGLGGQALGIYALGGGGALFGGGGGGGGGYGGGGYAPYPYNPYAPTAPVPGTYGGGYGGFV